jgi:hypothetical protein
MFIGIVGTVLTLMHLYVRVGAPPDITVLSLSAGP